MSSKHVRSLAMVLTPAIAGAMTAANAQQLEPPYGTYSFATCETRPALVHAQCETEDISTPRGYARLVLDVASPVRSNVISVSVPASGRAYGTAGVVGFVDLDQPTSSVDIRAAVNVHYARVMMGGGIPERSGTGGSADLWIVLTHTRCGTCSGSSGILLANSYDSLYPTHEGETILQASMTNDGNLIPAGRVLIDIMTNASASLGNGDMVGDTGVIQTAVEFDVAQIDVL